MWTTFPAFTLNQPVAFPSHTRTRTRQIFSSTVGNSDTKNPAHRREEKITKIQATGSVEPLLQSCRTHRGKKISGLHLPPRVRSVLRNDRSNVLDALLRQQWLSEKEAGGKNKARQGKRKEGKSSGARFFMSIQRVWRKVEALNTYLANSWVRLVFPLC